MRYSQTFESSSAFFRVRSSNFRLSVLFQWFLTALSVRPGRLLAISVYLLPVFCCTRSSHRLWVTSKLERVLGRM